MKLALTALVIGALLVPTYADRSDAPDPGAKRIADSVEAFSIDGSVDAYSIDGSVERLVTESTDAGVQTVTLGSDVLFAYNSAALDPAAQAAVDQLIEDLPSEATSVSVDGYTDSRGGDEVNIPLSQARAQSVADRIAAVRPDLSLTVTGHGSSDPVANEYPGGKADDDAMAQNRRVEITITA